MTKRTYINPASQKLRERALEQMRQTRERIDPDVLGRLRQAIRENESAGAAQDSSASGQVRLDRNHQLKVVMSFLETHKGNPKILGAVTRMLGET